MQLQVQHLLLEVYYFHNMLIMKFIVHFLRCLYAPQIESIVFRNVHLNVIAETKTHLANVSVILLLFRNNGWNLKKVSFLQNETGS